MNMGAPAMRYDSPYLDRAARADYTQWSIDELWQLASQLRVAGARSKSRRELIELFAAAPKATQR
jgi:hypothetical protein